MTVIGGGAAGFFCAVNAARLNPALRVILLEKTGKLLSKVRISGGGRCNVTHACFDITEMSKRYPRGGRFVKKTFHQFFTTDTINWFEERGVKLKTEADGRMFPVSDSSQTIIDCLLAEASKYGVEVMMKMEVESIQLKEGIFNLQTPNSQLLTTNYICIASGGYPRSPQFNWISQLGHTIEEPVPSLFTFNMPQHPLTKLMGISLENVMVRIQGTKLQQQGPLLITHWGLSGPAILKLSAWAARELKERNWEFGISVNWIAAFNEHDLREKLNEMRSQLASQKIINKNRLGIPQRLWEFLAMEAGISTEMRWADLPSAIQNKLVRNCCAYECVIKGKTTFKEEFVTAGGVRLNEIDPNAMMSKKIPGLFFAGEVLDADGITGGYNFQHAWTSGWIAAQAITKLASGS